MNYCIFSLNIFIINSSAVIFLKCFCIEGIIFERVDRFQPKHYAYLFNPDLLGKFTPQFFWQQNVLNLLYCSVVKLLLMCVTLGTRESSRTMPP